MNKKTKIAFVCIEDSDDITQFSGTTYFIKKAISLPDVEIQVIDKLKVKKSIILMFRKIIGKLIHKDYHIFRSKLVLKPIAKQIEKKLSNDVDFILTTSTLPITYLETKVPIFFYVDATFHSMLDFYFPVNKLSRRTLQEGNMQESTAINKATGALFASNWAALDAINYYKINKEKVKVLPFGANLNYPITANFIKNNLQEKLTNKNINILFVGVDWERKGGDVVYKTCKNLIERGYNVILDIVGIIDFPFKEVSNFCINHGFINKNNENGRKKLIELYLKTDFLFVPSKQECLGIVFAEASTLGVPSISTNVGGISNVIEHGITGISLDRNATPKMFEKEIISLVENKNKYNKMSLNAYHKSTLESNWEIIGRKIVNFMKTLT